MIIEQPVSLNIETWDVITDTIPEQWTRVLSVVDAVSGFDEFFSVSREGITARNGISRGNGF